MQLETKQKIKQNKIELENLLFSVLMNDWLATKNGNWDAVTYDKAVKSINRHIIPAFGERNYLEIAPHEWLDFLEVCRKI